MVDEIKKDSPDKDKGLGLTDDKPPDMGTGEELVEGKLGEETLPPDTGEGGEETLSPELEALMKKKGFKDLAEVAKAVDASDRKITELEKDARLRSLTEVPPRPKVERIFTDVPELKEEPFNMSKEELNTYLTQREKRAREELEAAYTDAEADKKWNREYRETMAVVNKDPERFEVLKPQLRALHSRYPNAPLSEIYPIADEAEKTQREENKKGIIADIFGPNADVDKLKTLISKARPAVVSDAGGAGATNVAKTGKQKAVEAIWEGIKVSDVRRD